jgi:hypothetical protein
MFATSGCPAGFVVVPKRSESYPSFTPTDAVVIKLGRICPGAPEVVAADGAAGGGEAIWALSGRAPPRLMMIAMVRTEYMSAPD